MNNESEEPHIELSPKSKLLLTGLVAKHYMTKTVDTNQELLEQTEHEATKLDYLKRRIKILPRVGK